MFLSLTALALVEGEVGRNFSSAIVAMLLQVPVHDHQVGLSFREVAQLQQE